MKMLLIATLINLFAYNSGDLIATYKTDQAESSLKVSGTSTVHDWEMEAKGMNGVMNVDLYEDSMDIKNLSLTVKVNSLKSGKSVMDDKTYDALKEEKHPTITYRMTEVSSLSKKGSGQYHLRTEGKLTIAGQTRTLEIPITAFVKNGSLDLKGSVPIKMTQFGVEPPSFMFGSVSTGDEVTVKFNINYKSTSK